MPVASMDPSTELSVKGRCPPAIVALPLLPESLPMPLSYAQNLEDFQLSLAFPDQTSGFYIDIGGGHPVADNVSLWFYERGWSGLVVEPQAALAAMYAHVRPRDAVVPCLVGRTEGEVDFHVFERFHGLSTIVPGHAGVAAGLGEVPRVERRAMTTLAALCSAHGVGTIDFLKVDVEGAEADVLAGNDWARFRPRVVVLEAIAPGTGAPAWDAFEPFLLAQGYGFVLFDTLNRFYVASEHPKIAARFDGARADWASATHLYEIGRAPETAAHPDHALASDLARGFWAGLPAMEADDLARMILRGRGEAGGAVAATAAWLRSPEGRIARRRIACGYDGGQV